MKRFLTSIALIIFFGTVPSVAYYLWLYRNLPPSKDMNALDYALNDSTYHDIIFLGASKVEVDVDPRVIDSITGLNSYSLAIGGMGILEADMLIRTYLKHHPAPKLLFVNIDYVMFNTNRMNQNAPDYFSYMKRDSSIRHMLSKHNQLYKDEFAQQRLMIKKVFATTDARRMRVMFPDAYEQYYPPTHQADYKGYRAVKLGWLKSDEPDPKAPRQKVVSTETGYKLLTDLVSYCSSKNIDVIFLFIPEHTIGDNYYSGNEKVLQRVSEISNELNVPFWNYRNHPIRNEINYYYNFTHLNYKGSQVFSIDLANDINKYYDATNSID